MSHPGENTQCDCICEKASTWGMKHVIGKVRGVFLCSRSVILFWILQRHQVFIKAWVCACDCEKHVCVQGDHGTLSDLSWDLGGTLSLPAATSAGAQSENTQNRLSAQLGPVAHSARLRCWTVLLSSHCIFNYGGRWRPKLTWQEIQHIRKVVVRLFRGRGRPHNVPNFQNLEWGHWQNLYLYLEVTRWSY